MKSPIANIDLNFVSTTSRIDCNWFDKKEVCHKNLIFLDTNDTIHKMLKQTHSAWDLGVQRTRGVYKDAVEYSHTSAESLVPRSTQCKIEIDSKNVTLSKNFHFTIYNGHNIEEPLGFVTGEYAVVSPVNLDLDNNSQNVTSRCYIEAIELAPEYQDRGVGTSIIEAISETYGSFVSSVISQIDENLLGQINFDSIVESDIDSNSGMRWITKLHKTLDKQTSEVLLDYNVCIDNINHAYLEA